MASIFQKCKTDKQSKDFPCEKTRCGHSWTVSYREPGGRQGKKRERSFKLKREAEIFAAQTESDKNQGVYVDPDRGKIPVRVWAEDWLSRHIVHESTRRNYQGFITNHLVPNLGRKTIAGLTPADVKTLQAEMVRGGLAAATVNDRMNVLRSMMSAAVKERRIPFNPFDDVPQLKTGTLAVDQDEIPTLAEVNALADAISPQYRLTVWLMAGAGLRISEALGFSKDCQRDGFLRLRRQVSAKANRGDCVTRLVPLKHRTAEEYRDIPTAPFLDEEINAHLARWGTVEVDGLEVLFSPRERGKGSMPTASTYGYHFKKACIAAGLVDGRGEVRFTPHSLRHFFASTALANGVSLLEVSRWLGHRSINVTADTYGHIVAEAWDRCRDVIQGALRPDSPVSLTVAA